MSSGSEKGDSEILDIVLKYLRSGWITLIILIIFITFYIIQLFNEKFIGNVNLNPSAIKSQWQLWRLITPIFIHPKFFDFLSILAGAFAVCYASENIFLTKWKFVFWFFTFTIIGNLSGVILFPNADTIRLGFHVTNAGLGAAVMVGVLGTRKIQEREDIIEKQVEFITSAIFGLVVGTANLFGFNYFRFSYPILITLVLGIILGIRYARYFTLTRLITNFDKTLERIEKDKLSKIKKRYKNRVQKRVNKSVKIMQRSSEYKKMSNIKYASRFHFKKLESRERMAFFVLVGMDDFWEDEVTLPSNEMLYVLGRMAMLSGFAGDALKCFDRAIQRGPPCYKHMVSKADILWMLEQKANEAEELYKKALEMNPNYAEGLNNYGYFLVKYKVEIENKEKLAENKFEAVKPFLDQAYNLFEKAIQLEPELSFPYYNIGYMLIQLKKFEQAEIYLKKSNKLFHRDATTYELGRLYVLKNELKKANKSLKKIGKRNPLLYLSALDLRLRIAIELNQERKARKLQQKFEKMKKKFENKKAKEKKRKYFIT